MLMGCSNIYAASPKAEDFPDGSLVELTGRLVHSWAYGAPNYGETPEADTKDHFLVLVVNEKIRLKSEDGKELVEIKYIQLSFNGRGDSLNKQVSMIVEGEKQAQVSGRIYLPRTGHDHKDATLLVEAVTSVEGKK